MTAHKTMTLTMPLLLAFVFALLPLAARAGEDAFDRTVDSLRAAPPPVVKRFAGSESTDPYAVFVHSETLAAAMKASYSLADIERLMELTRDARRIDVVDKEWGTFVQAASFESAEMGDSTNYDAVWVRDSVWAYLALAAEENRRGDAKKVLLSLLDYMASEAQLQRMRRAVSNPSRLEGEAGDMNAVHIRFDSSSPDFADVMENGSPQSWTHKQNDALGLLVDAALDAYREGLVTLADLEEKDRLVGVAGIVAYLNAARFHEMEDSGAWEELARRNTSSIALVTSAVANLYALLGSSDAAVFAESYEKAASKFGSPDAARPHALAEMLWSGYDTVRYQLALGGESPNYDPEDRHYRGPDAALLNLVYPARLDRLHLADKLTALDLVASLVGDYGIRRYDADDYQSANFWFKGIKTDTDPESHEERRRNFIPGTEAQWFFDSWFALSSLCLYEETGDEAFIPLATRHLNRALGQITGAGRVISADGKTVKSNATPESYNFLVSGGEMFAAPSPICPLNWAKASLTLALEHFRRVLDDERRTRTAER